MLLFGFFPIISVPESVWVFHNLAAGHLVCAVLGALLIFVAVAFITFASEPDPNEARGALSFLALGVASLLFGLWVIVAMAAGVCVLVIARFVCNLVHYVKLEVSS